MIKVLGLALYGPLAASNRYRLAQYKDGLISSSVVSSSNCFCGISVISRQLYWVMNVSLIKLAWKRVYMLLTKHNYDLIILHCELMPMIPAFLEKMLLRRPIFMILTMLFF